MIFSVSLSNLHPYLIHFLIIFPAITRYNINHTVLTLQIQSKLILDFCQITPLAAVMSQSVFYTLNQSIRKPSSFRPYQWLCNDPPHTASHKSFVLIHAAHLSISHQEHPLDIDHTGSSSSFHKLSIHPPGQSIHSDMQSPLNKQSFYADVSRQSSQN